jgi:hypothetical protein
VTITHVRRCPWVAPSHLGSHVGDEGVLVGGEAGPHPLGHGTLRALAHGLGVRTAKEAVEHLLGPAHTWLLAVDGGHRRHHLLVGFFALFAADGLHGV